MPAAALHPCNAPHCTELVPVPYCNAHRRYRSPADERTHRRWRRVRVAYLRSQGWRCERCKQRPPTASELHAHHIQPLAEGGALYEWSNLEALCEPCHVQHHGGEQVHPDGEGFRAKTNGLEVGTSGERERLAGERRISDPGIRPSWWGVRGAEG